MHYFDNAATSFPKPEIVYSTMNDFYRNYGVNVGRGQYKTASIAANMVEETRNLMTNLFHSPYGYSCVFTSSATEALNTIIQGIHWKNGMNVYITPFEHNAVLRSLYHIKQLYEINVHILNPQSDFQFDLSTVKNTFLSGKPDVVVLTHASNAFGNIVPIKEIFSIAKLYDAITVCDMAQTAGLIDVDIKNSHIDYLVFAGHKTLYGPYGVAGFVTYRKGELSPLIYGGTGMDSKNPNMPDEMPVKYEAGSPNIHAISGLNASLKWIKQTGIQNIRDKELIITKQLIDILKQHRNIRIIHCAGIDSSIGVVSCLFDGYSSDSIGQVLSDHDIAVRTGLHCAPLAHEFAKTSPAGTVRFSISYFTSEEDLCALEEVLMYIEMNS